MGNRRKNCHLTILRLASSTRNKHEEETRAGLFSAGVYNVGSWGEQQGSRRATLAVALTGPMKFESKFVKSKLCIRATARVAPTVPTIRCYVKFIMQQP